MPHSKTHAEVSGRVKGRRPFPDGRGQRQEGRGKKKADSLPSKLSQELQ